MLSAERIFVTYFNERTGDALTKLRYVVAVYSFLITIVFFGVSVSMLIIFFNFSIKLCYNNMLKMIKSVATAITYLILLILSWLGRLIICGYINFCKTCGNLEK